jgi:hypothetical protein
MGWFKDKPEKPAKKKFCIEDYMPDPPEALPEDPTLTARVSALESDVRDLKSSLANIEDIEDWFRKNIKQLCEYAAKEFTQQREAETQKQIRQAVQQAVQQSVRPVNYEEIFDSDVAIEFALSIIRGIGKRLGQRW